MRYIGGNSGCNLDQAGGTPCAVNFSQGVVLRRNVNCRWDLLMVNNPLWSSNAFAAQRSNSADDIINGDLRLSCFARLQRIHMYDKVLFKFA